MQGLVWVVESGVTSTYWFSSHLSNVSEWMIQSQEPASLNLNSGHNTLPLPLRRSTEYLKVQNRIFSETMHSRLCCNWVLLANFHVISENLYIWWLNFSQFCFFNFFLFFFFLCVFAARCRCEIFRGNRMIRKYMSIGINGTKIAASYK